MADTVFTPHSYLLNAQESLKRAYILHDAAHDYFAAHYFAGIAIESILRAHGTPDGASFDSTHSIDYWASKAESNGLRPSTENSQDEFRARLNEANVRWRANHRYLPERKLETYLWFTKLDKVRGDRVKYSSAKMLKLADQIVKFGVIKWTRR